MSNLITKACKSPQGVHLENLRGVFSPLPEILTLFITKISDFPYPIYDLTKNVIPYLWPDPFINTGKMTCFPVFRFDIKDTV